MDSNHCVSVPSGSAEEILSGQRRGGVQLNLQSNNIDKLAPAKGILAGLALSALLWVALLAAWCF
jgi:hypothetical protein